MKQMGLFDTEIAGTSQCHGGSNLCLCKHISITFAETWHCLSWRWQAGFRRFSSFERWLGDKVGCLFPAAFPPRLSLGIVF